MTVAGKVSVRCSSCGARHDAALLQSINSRQDPEAKRRLLAGDLNVAGCACGKRTQLEANLVYHDPDLGLLCHVCPDGEPAVRRAEEAFAAAFAGAADGGAAIAQRIVPSLNALVEKVKILDAGLLDWAVEMTKVLLLASIAVEDDDRVLLFAQRTPGQLHWWLFDAHAERAEPMVSPLDSYARLVDSSGGAPAPQQRRIDRAWAVEAVRQLINRGN
jgi:CpXC protein